MTRDEIKLVVFILSALLVGALVQTVRTRHAIPPAAAPPAKSHAWAKPPYVLTERKGRGAPANDSEP